MVTTGWPHSAETITEANETAQLLRNGTLKTYPGFPHGMPTTQPATPRRDPVTPYRGGNFRETHGRGVDKYG